MAEGQVDTKLSIGQMSLEALVDLKASVDGMTDLFRKYLRAQEEYQQRGPLQLALRTSGTSGSSGDLGFGFGGPKYGRLWEIRRVIVGGLDWDTTVSGSAQLYVASVPALQMVNNDNLADMVDQAATLPSVAFYSSGQIVLRHPQELHIVIDGPSATTSYVASAGGFDIPDMPAQRVVGE